MRKSTDVEHFSILSKIHKRTKDSEYFKVFPIFLLTASIVANKVPVYCYHLQVYAFVHVIKIIEYVVKLWFVVKICHFVRPTQTSILAASTRTWRCVYRLYCQIFVINETECYLCVLFFNNQHIVTARCYIFRCTRRKWVRYDSETLLLWFGKRCQLIFLF